MVPILFVVFLDLVGFGMVIPILPFSAERLGIAPSLIIFLFGLYSLGQLIGAPVWGAASDRVGRKPILLATLAANAAANMLLAVASDGWQLGISRLVSGLAAGNISTAYAYVADVTDDLTRPRALGLLGAGFGFGFIVGPAIGGLLAGESSDNISRVAHAAAIMSAMAFLATLFFLRESHGREKRQAHAHHVREPRLRLLRRPVLGQLLVATMVVIGAVSMLHSSYSIWGATYLGFSARTLGWIFGFIGVLSVMIQGGGIGILTRRFGAPHLTHGGVYMLAASLVAVPFLRSAWLTLIPMALYAVGAAIFMPSMSTMIAETAAPHERGTVMGAFQGMGSLGRVIGPLLAAGMAAVAGLNAPFVLAAAVAIAGAFLVHPRPRIATDSAAADSGSGHGS